MGASIDKERLRGLLGEPRNDGLDGLGENAGLKGRSRESLSKVIGLSAMVECVGAGESGREACSDKRDDVSGGEVEWTGELSVTGLAEEAELSRTSVEGRGLPWAARARTTAS